MIRKNLSYLTFIGLLLLGAVYCQNGTKTDATNTSAAGYTSLPKEGAVTILTDKTFKQVIKNNDYVLVYFYASWCGMCQKFSPRYNTMAGNADVGVLFTKMNAEKHDATASKYDVQSYPTLLLFVKGKPYQYDGGFEDYSILQFLKKIILQPIEPVDGSIEEKVQASEKIILYIPQGGDADAIVTEAARKHQFVDFISVKDQSEAAKVLKGNSGNLFVIKRQGSEVVPFKGKEISEKLLNQFIKEHQYDLIVTGDELESIDRIFEPGSKPAMVGIFDDQESPEFKAYSEFANSQGVSGGLLFFVSKIGAADDNLATFTGLAENNRIAIIKGRSNYEVNRFIMNKPITLKNIKDFYQDYREGRVLKYYRSETEPTEQGPLKKVVANTFRQYVPSVNSKSVLLFAFDDNCETCPKAEKAVTQLASSGTYSNVDFIKINWQRNDIPTFKVEDTPAFIYFRPGDSKPIFYKGGSLKKDAIEEFLKKQLKKYVPEEKTDL